MLPLAWSELRQDADRKQPASYNSHAVIQKSYIPFHKLELGPEDFGIPFKAFIEKMSAAKFKHLQDISLGNTGSSFQ